MEQVRGSQRTIEAAGRDFACAIHLKEHHALAITELAYDRDEPNGNGWLQPLIGKLIDEAAARGNGEYRTHIELMDRIAGTYGFNNHALRRLNEQVKDMLDPAGIIAPGKSGIWPRRFRKEETQ
jgi:4-cresol dehydrogenase (hydroxylating)